MIVALSQYYAFTEWRSINWATVSAAGMPDAMLADMTEDPQQAGTYAILAVTKVIASISDGEPPLARLFVSTLCRTGHVEHDLFPECGYDAFHDLNRVRYGQIGGGYGFTMDLLDDGVDGLSRYTNH